MHGALLGVNASSGLAASPVLGVGLTGLRRRPQQAHQRDPPTPCLLVVCGKSKGRGKASRPVRPVPPSPQAPVVPAEPPPSTQPQAPRITPANTSRRSLKALKRIASFYKQVQQVSAGNSAAVKRAPAPAFRRRPVDSDEFKQQRAVSEAEAERNRKRSGQSASFASLYGTKGQKTPPVLLVDGYNVLGELAKLGRGGRELDVSDSCDLADAHAFDESARSRLELQLVAYSHSRGVKVVLVFDAMGGMSRTTLRTTKAGAIDVVYCAAEEADSWIVQEAARLVAAGSKSVLVATNDQCIKDCLSGAFFVSSALLLKEVTKVEKEASRHEQASLQLMASRGLGAVLAAKDPALLRRLNDMR